MNNNILDRGAYLLDADQELSVKEQSINELSIKELSAPAAPDDEEDKPQLRELLFDIGLAVTVYLCLGLVCNIIVTALHL